MVFSAVINIQTEKRLFMTKHYLKQQLPFYVNFINNPELIEFRTERITASSQDEAVNKVKDAIDRVLDDYHAEVRLLQTDLEAYDKFDISNKGSIVSGS